ncbi:hypothetical protein [Microbulbifer sp. A4B17]|uniref:hypothetical protein n=1 Tax=Microbulbifer sp. A4B17 TaxID=359370 RepID=UPI001300925D
MRKTNRAHPSFSAYFLFSFDARIDLFTIGVEGFGGVDACFSLPAQQLVLLFHFKGFRRFGALWSTYLLPSGMAGYPMLGEFGK